MSHRTVPPDNVAPCINLITWNSIRRGNDAFMANDIRTKPDLDGMGSLGDLGWWVALPFLRLDQGCSPL